MRRISPLQQSMLVSFSLLWCSVLVAAQSPSSIQFFLPDGSLPARELRFTMTSDAGLVDTFYTDSRGRFLLTRSQGLKPDATYTITVEGDKRTYGTTVQTFKMYSVGHITIFLKPLESQPLAPAGVVDVSQFDAAVPEAARDVYDQAMKSFKDGETDEAIKQLHHAIEIHPEYFRALNDLGVILMQVRRLDEAASAFDRASQIAPKAPLPRLNLGVIRTRQKRYKEAVEILDRLYKENPLLTEVRTPLGDALMAMNRLDDAEKHFRAVLASDNLEPRSEGNTRYLLGLLLNRKQRFAEAEKELRLAQKILPNGARIHFQLGAALVQLKRYDEAERHLQEAYRLNSADLGAAQFMLGEIYFITKRYESALRAFEQYLRDVPTAPNADEVQRLIDRIRSAISQK